MDETQLRMFQAALSPQNILAIGLVNAIAGYDLPVNAQSAFKRFGMFMASNSQPDYVVQWRSSPTTERWYLAHANGIENARNALVGAYYHRDNLADIESTLLSRLERLGLADMVPPNSTMAFGGTLKLDLEYQAFILSARRCLDYLTRGLAAYFKQEFHSFREMNKSLQRFEQTPVATAIRNAHARHVALLDFLLSDGTRKSVRDTITHREHVQAGTLNATKRGLFFAGGGERLSSAADAANGTSIAMAMDRRLEAVQRAVDDVLTSFLDAVQGSP